MKKEFLKSNAFKSLCVIVALAVAFTALVLVVVDVNKKAAQTEGHYDKNWMPQALGADEYVSVSKSDNSELFVNFKNGKFYLEDKNSGKKWYSTPENLDKDTISKGVAKAETNSELVLRYIYTIDENSNSQLQKANSAAVVNAANSLEVLKTENGVKVTYDFKNLEIRVRVLYTLKDDIFKATVLTDEIEDGTNSYLVELGLLPFFGAAGADDNGYLFVPDGSGAVVKFNNGIIQSQNYEKYVYGDDLAASKTVKTAISENILVPVFGTAYDSGAALMGVITEGDGAAKILAVNGNARSYYNTVSSKMIYRIYSQGNSLYKNNHTNLVSTVTHNSFDSNRYTVSYYMLSGDKANYSGMAEKYGEYLKSVYNLKPKNTKPALALDIYGAITQKTTSLGVTHDKSYTLTSFEDAKEIVEKLKGSGVDNLVVRYLGWSGNGVFNSGLPTSAKPMDVLGGKKDFENLADYLKKNGFEFYPDFDAVTFTENGGGFSYNSDSAKGTNGAKAMQNKYSPVSFEPLVNVNPWALTKPKLYSEILNKFITNYSKLNIDSVSLSQIGDCLYSDFSKDGGVYRTKSVGYATKMLKSASKKLSKVATSGGNIYAAASSDRVFDLPSSSSGYAIFEYDVPFVQIVLNGYVDYTTPYIKQSAEPKKEILKAIETGSDLLFACVSDETYPLSDTRLSEFFSSEFSMWKDEAIGYYTDFCEVAEKIGNQTIVSHECLAEDMFKITYSGGTEVYVNYSDNYVTTDSITVGAMNYFVKE